MTDPSEASAVSDDRRRLRAGDGAVPWSPTIVEGSIADRFAEMVRRFPDRPAVVAGGTVTSYAGLDARTGAIARAIQRAVAADHLRPVALLLDQGPDLPAAAMGALRTGSPFVPVDPAYPDASLQARLDHADAAIVLATAATLDLARRIAGDRPVLDVGAIAFDPSSAAWVDPPIDPGALATLFYTSGSTGRPKGVLDSHRNVLHNVGRYTSSLQIGSGDRLTLLHAPTFSGIVSTLFAGLLNGAAVLPFDLRHEGLERIGAWLVEERATMLHCVPVVARGIFLGAARFPDLRVVRLEGDLATWADVERFRAHASAGAMLVNGLGATETGLTRQFFIAQDHGSGTERDDRSGALPIGYPVPDMTIRIRDAAGASLDDGSLGEIVVASEFLALGYLGDPERTAAAFGVDPVDPTRRTYRTGDLGRLDPDGRLHHLGRLDGSHKVNGQTVDPGETERVLEARPEVRAAVAVTRRDERADPADPGGTDPRLVAYVVREPWHVLDVVRLRHDLGAALPDVQVPAVIVEIPALPVTAAGKVDRTALPEPGHGRPPLASAYRSASDPLEEELVAIWGAAIPVAPIGVDDDFFELGGDSLAALRMLLELGSAYGREVPADVLVRAPTIAGLAAELRTGERHPGATDGPGLLRLSDGAGPPLFAVHAAEDRPWLFRSLARARGWDRPLMSLGPDGTATSPWAEASIDLAASAGLARIRAVQPSGPYHLAGFCYGGVIAFEIAHRLRAADEEVALLALLSVTPLEFPTLVSPDARRRYGRNVLRRRGRLLVDLWRKDGSTRTFREALDRAARLATVERHRRRTRRSGGGADTGADRDIDAPDLRSARAAAIDAYDARPFPGEVVVVVGRDAVPGFLRDPHDDLAGLSTASVRVAVLAGDDHDMLAEPEVEALARVLSEGSSGVGRYDAGHGQ